MEKHDAADLLAISGTTLECLKDSGASSLKCYELLEALHERTYEYLHEHQLGSEAAHVTAQEWLSMIKSVEDAESARRQLKEHLSKLRERLESAASTIEQRLRQSGQRQRLKIGSTESKGGHKKYYFLSLEPFEDAESSLADLPPKGIRYRVRHFEKPLPWAKPFFNVDLEGARRWIPLAPAALALIAITSLLIVLNGDWGELAIIGATIFVYAGFGLFDAMEKMTRNGVAEAPFWMCRLSDYSAHFELVPTGEIQKNGRRNKTMRLVAYDAECGVCGAPVDVVKGRGPYRGRLIGACSVAGAEHLYSFDHISKVGVPLHENAYFEKLPNC